MKAQNGILNSIEAQKILSDYIDSQLYPEESFPRSQFPGLAKILTDAFMIIIKSDPLKRKRFQSCTKPSELTRLAHETLNIKNILEKYPHHLILIYRHLISKYIGIKHQKNDEKEDIVQEILSRVLADKIPKIQRQYDFNFKKIPSFTSYFMVIVRNIYIDIIRERKNHMFKTVELSDSDHHQSIERFQPEKARLIIDREVTKLHYILKMYYQSRPKIEIIMKIKFRIPVLETEVRRCFPRCTPQDEAVLTRDYKFLKDKDVFETIISVFNRNENKKNRSDTLRKWIAIKTDEIISHLNRTHDYPVYNNDNISDLIALYYQRQPSKREANEN